MDKNGNLLENYKNIQELIRFADQKAGIILIIYGFLVTIFLELSKNFYIVNPSLCSTKSLWTFIVACMFLILMFIQIFLIIFKIIVPRKAKQYKNNEICCFYYEHIAQIDKKEFLKKIEKQTENEQLIDLSTQTYEVALILKRKNENVRRTLYCLFATIATLAIYAILTKI